MGVMTNLVRSRRCARAQRTSSPAGSSPGQRRTCRQPVCCYLCAWLRTQRSCCHSSDPSPHILACKQSQQVLILAEVVVKIKMSGMRPCTSCLCATTFGRTRQNKGKHHEQTTETEAESQTGLLILDAGQLHLSSHECHSGGNLCHHAALQCPVSRACGYIIFIFIIYYIYIYYND